MIPQEVQGDQDRKAPYASLRLAWSRLAPSTKTHARPCRRGRLRQSLPATPCMHVIYTTTLAWQPQGCQTLARQFQESSLRGRLRLKVRRSIVLAQHLDPTRPGHLAAILAQHGALPIHTVTDHESLQAGVVFVVPASRYVEITNHDVHVRSGALPPPKPSIDLLPRSATRTVGEWLVAVVLTGMGSDGADGRRRPNGRPTTRRGRAWRRLWRHC
ncbi:MAG TPA: chemotaxis protein CheB [Chloroflexota bacterium]|nr:chemotaxis protein CheB [Chloroflexota bacterium]